ncbi:MAG: VWA domain-containing protein [Hyphomicrobium sp.]|nr:VWA domain-containing protein [Hyphomicrobium sp.]
MINFLYRFDPRFVLLVVAAIAATVAATGLRYTARRSIVDATIVVDLTGSMNARDAGVAGKPVSRIEAVRAAVRDLAQSLPCRSRLGLGIFTERRSFLLFEPADICANFDAFDGAISDLDWRMAWEGDSYIAKGLYSAIDVAASAKSDLIFFSDGHEAPPIPASGIPDFEGVPGKVNGLIVGVGGSGKSPIPKFDDDGRETGVISAADVPHDNRHGLPGKSVESAAGWHPRNAPFGAQAVAGEEHLTSVRSEHLRTLASKTGLSYLELNAGRNLRDAVLRSGTLRMADVPENAAPWFAIAALASLLAAYGISVSALRRASQKLSTLVR